MKYVVERDIQTMNQINHVLESLPTFCHAFFLGIEQTTSPLTRLGYARDLEIFFNYLIHETEAFHNYGIFDFEKSDLNKITIDDIELYVSFLTHYRKDDTEHFNSERGKMRKMATLRSFFKYFYRRGDLKENIMTKIDLPKLHEKSILRLSDDEVSKMKVLSRILVGIPIGLILAVGMIHIPILFANNIVIKYLIVFLCNAIAVLFPGKFVPGIFFGIGLTFSGLGSGIMPNTLKDFMIILVVIISFCVLGMVAAWSSEKLQNINIKK